MKKFFNALAIICITIGFLGVILCAVTFMVINQGIISYFHFACFLVAFVITIPMMIYAILRTKKTSKSTFIAGIMLTVIATLATIGAYLVLNVYFVFQPYVNTGFVHRLSPYFGFTFIGGTILFLITNKRSYLPLFASITILCLLFLGFSWSFYQPYGDYDNTERHEYLFVGQEGDYYSYRIPALTCMEKDIVKSKLGVETEGDVLVALAEGRRNSADDEGQIDMMMRVSFDSGKTWTKEEAVLKFVEEDGKYGNPTPVFDKETGIFHLVYAAATKANGFDSYKMYDMQGRLMANKTFAWAAPKEISFGDDSVAVIPGPNKGICLSDGRLAFACYENFSDKEALGFVVFSDDHGESWYRSEYIDAGNECDLIQMSDGSLLYVLRGNGDCSGIHAGEYQRFYRSVDGGITWQKQDTETPLATPICECSLNKKGDEIYITYPDCHLTRADLSISFSADGSTFRTYLLYDGAAGYSSAVTLSSGEICVLAEVGRVNYAERLVFIVVDSDAVK